MTGSRFTDDLPVVTGAPARGAHHTGGGPPIHPLAALLMVAVDNLWNLADWAVIDWWITIPLSFVTVFVPTLLIQRFLKKDPGGRAAAYAAMLGTVAAVPTSLTGTPVGMALLAWAGISRLLGHDRRD